MSSGTTSGWINIKNKMPKEEGYYPVKFKDGTQDEKPYRIRPNKNIRGFMYMNSDNPITHWKDSKL